MGTKQPFKFWIVTLSVLIALGGLASWWQAHRMQRLWLERAWWPYAKVAKPQPISLKTASKTHYDVLVIGSEPEGVAAAVAAAQEGATVLLITQDTRIGGLFVMGMMNSLDLRTQPTLLHKGLFETWWNRVGRGSSFDVGRAEHAFKSLLAEAGVDVVMNYACDWATCLTIATEAASLHYVQLADTRISVSHLIDASANADAAQLAASFTLGWQSMGRDPEVRMVDTLVFQINGVNWSALQQGIKARGTYYAEVNDRVAWGHFRKNDQSLIKRYQALEPGIRLRGLNLGLQDDSTVLVNALLIHGIDLTDQASIAAGKARAEREAQHIITFLREDGVPGMAGATLGGTAPALYIREYRHLKALCQLTVDDVLDNVVTPHDIAAGGYPLDVQALTPHDTGYVYGVPEVYGARLCHTVPHPQTTTAPLWVIGKSAGFDPIGHSSARVVPFGMTVAEAVGVAAAWAVREGKGPAQVAQDVDFIHRLRGRLLERGAYLAEVKPRVPTGPVAHPYYWAYRTLRHKGLALGGYQNDPKLDEGISALGYLYLLSNVAQRFHNRADIGQTLVDKHYDTLQDQQVRLQPALALTLTADAACAYGDCVAADWSALQQAQLAPAPFPVTEALTRGEAYALAAYVAQRYLAPPENVADRACWDTNANALPDLAEDHNADTYHNALDCVLP